MLFLFMITRTAPAATITQSFDSNGNSTSHSLGKSGTHRPAAASRYAAPEGIELHGDITYEYYPVFGKSFSEAVKSAEENGPLVRNKNVRSTSKFAWGLGFSFQYDYTFETDEDTRTVHATIDIPDVEMTYDIVITIPALLDDTELSPVEKKLWKNYLRRILEREYGRAAIVHDEELKKKAVEEIKGLKEVVFDYTNRRDIDAAVEFFLKEESAGIGRDLIKKINERLAEYDRKAAPGSSRARE